MSEYKNAVGALSDVAEKLQDQMDQKESVANVFISKNKMQTLNEYVFLFCENLDNIIQHYKLNTTEIRIVLKILNYMRFGNLISLSITSLANDLNLNKSNVSRAMKKLKSTELIVEMNGNLFFNPHVACKGVFDERKDEDRQLLDYSAVIIEQFGNNASPSIATKNIRKKCKTDAVTNDEIIDKRIKDFFS